MALRLLGALALVAAMAGTAHAGRSGATLPMNCTDQTVRPVRVRPGCDQNRVQLITLRWRRWGSATARATGLAAYNTCIPDCPSGEGRHIPVEVTASRLRRCRNGRLQYTRLHYTPTTDDALPYDGARLPCAGG